jgi:hypothetical protein
MPLLDHFRLPRPAKAAPPPVVDIPGGPITRLDRMVARQRRVGVPSEMEQRLQALEEEYSQPLYAASAYSSPDQQSEED